LPGGFIRFGWGLRGVESNADAEGSGFFFYRAHGVDVCNCGLFSQWRMSNAYGVYYYKIGGFFGGVGV